MRTIAFLSALVVAACSHPPPGSVGATARRDPALLPSPVDVAITIDDLPRHGPALPGRGPPEIAAALLDAFRRHGVPEVYGFVNGGKLERNAQDRAALETWIAAAQPLGNHTDDHSDLNASKAEAFVAAIGRNEPLLQDLQRGVPETTWKVFRYPFLREGADLDVRDQVRGHLAAHGYRIAQVTIDPYDWAYTPVYARCLAAGRQGDADAVRKAFLSEARAKLRWADAEARMLLGRPIRQILLLHLGLIDADAIDALLSDYERLGVRWVRLREALEDPIYEEDPHVTYGGVYLFQLFEARGVRPPPPPLTPTALLETMCKEPSPPPATEPQRPPAPP